MELTERLLGHHPQTGEAVYARIGPYGLYVQQGEAPPKPAAGKKKKAAKGAAVEAPAAKARRAQAPKVGCVRGVGLVLAIREQLWWLDAQVADSGGRHIPRRPGTGSRRLPGVLLGHPQGVLFAASLCGTHGAAAACCVACSGLPDQRAAAEVPLLEAAARCQP